MNTTFLEYDNSIWKDEEVIVLIQLWGEHLEDFRKPGKNLECIQKNW